VVNGFYISFPEGVYLLECNNLLLLYGPCNDYAMVMASKNRKIQILQLESKMSPGWLELCS